MTQIKDKSVLITGGANGMGRIMAEEFLKRGAKNVTLWDIDRESLAKTASELEKYSKPIFTDMVDIRNRDLVDRSAAVRLKEQGRIDILVNNAGVVSGKPFLKQSADDIDRTMDVNIRGMMHVTRNFLPAMVAHGGGHIVNFASAAGLTPNPNMSVYVSSKWAAIGWSESLRIEMDLEKNGVKVLTIAPSYISTGMFEGVKAPLLTPIIKPEKMVEKIIKGIEKNSIMIKAPLMVNVLPLARAILPARWFDIIAGEGFGLYHSMDKFKGRGI